MKKEFYFEEDQLILVVEGLKTGRSINRRINVKDTRWNEVTYSKDPNCSQSNLKLQRKLNICFR
jgi:hypothetical protein